MKKPVNVFWFRRDLRLDDNAGLFHALNADFPVVPVFIFDSEILDKLSNKKDARVQFIHQELETIKSILKKFGSDLDVRYGQPLNVWKAYLADYDVKNVYVNRDYEPYARRRDMEVANMLSTSEIRFFDFKDQIIFDRDEIVKSDRTPYKVYTPYSKAWLANLSDTDLQPFENKKHFDNFYQFKGNAIPSLDDMGFESFDFEYPSREIDNALVKTYSDTRDVPGMLGTSRLGIHLRFGTLSIRELTRLAKKLSNTWLNELIWRNFYQVIIWHFPNSIENAFKPQYDKITWRHDPQGFQSWCDGNTGYPLVDAGMRELNATGFMHNRVRMVVASFVTKHLLIDWRLGEAYFAEKLLDFDLASNNGGWQWAAGSGCDAAPYFRIFNPELQLKKFDPKFDYLNKWVPEFQDFQYPQPIVDHKLARQRAIDTYKQALDS